MRDPDCTVPWSDKLTFRVQYQEARTFETNYDVRTQTIASASTAGALEAKDKSVKDAVLDAADPKHTSSECKVMRSSSRNLAALHSLPPTSLVLLLTPVLTPAKTDQSPTKFNSTDPFESLGRELSKQHHRLRHVPYVPKVGMTGTHAAFIEQAAAVVVVICESSNPDSESLEYQQTFADAVVAKREDCSDDDDDAVPFVLIRFDSSGARCTDNEYKNVLLAPTLTRTASTRAAEILFKVEDT